MQTTTCDDIVTRVSGLLNDQYPGNEFVRWSKNAVECAYREARGAVNLIRPDLAVSTVEMDLQPGTLQRVPEGCLQLVDVVGLLDENGNITEKASSGSGSLSKWFTSECASSSGDYTLDSFERDKHDNTIFFVQPPVPVGTEKKIMIKCAGGCGDDNAVDCRFEAPIIEYMMFRLLGTEDDSSTAAAASATHLRTFAMLLNINYNMMNVVLEETQNAVAPPED